MAARTLAHRGFKGVRAEWWLATRHERRDGVVNMLPAPVKVTQVPEARALFDQAACTSLKEALHTCRAMHTCQAKDESREAKDESREAPRSLRRGARRGAPNHAHCMGAGSCRKLPEAAACSQRSRGDKDQRTCKVAPDGIQQSGGHMAGIEQCARCSWSLCKRAVSRCDGSGILIHTIC